MGVDGCNQSPLGPGEVGTSTCLACHDGRSATDHREFLSSPHKAISCESCHGPGLTHVRQGGRLGLFIDNPGDQPFEVRHEACIECHAQASSPGGNTVQGFLASAHFTGNAATCTDCHNVHNQGAMAISAESPTRFGNENFAKLCGKCHEDTVDQFSESGHAQLDVATCASCHDMHSGSMLVASPEDNRLCLQCHQSTQLGFETDEDVAAHTGHPVDPAGSGASRCTGCHLPPLEAGGAAGHDHTLFTIPPIASNEAMEQGVQPAPPNSCAGVTGCHDAAVPGSGMPHDENDLDSNENLQSLYELIGVLP
jgi:predicted CXXCH cytochrome family protein